MFGVAHYYPSSVNMLLSFNTLAFKFIGKFKACQSLWERGDSPVLPWAAACVLETAVVRLGPGTLNSPQLWAVSTGSTRSTCAAPSEWLSSAQALQAR